MLLAALLKCVFMRHSSVIADWQAEVVETNKEENNWTRAFASKAHKAFVARSLRWMLYLFEALHEPRSHESNTKSTKDPPFPSCANIDAGLCASNIRGSIFKRPLYRATTKGAAIVDPRAVVEHQTQVRIRGTEGQSRKVRNLPPPIRLHGRLIHLEKYG